MQLLYMGNRNSAMSFDKLLRTYRTNVDKGYDLYLLSLLQFVKIARYAKRDADTRKRKHILSEEDRHFTDKLATNELLVSLFNNEDFIQKIERRKLGARLDGDTTRRLYQEFAQLDTYRDYLQQETSTIDDHRQILLALYKFCAGNESYNDVMEDFSPYWSDDKSLVVGTVKKTIRALPATDRFLDTFLPAAETSQFGEELLRQTYYESDDLMALIEPQLNNWDADRLATIDTLLLQMGLAEFLYFPTIPTTVTLNEFVDISKIYSTEKSKDFINGILDRLMKKLEDQGRIQKESRRKG
jgi:N utilization substance protein B